MGLFKNKTSPSFTCLAVLLASRCDPGVHAALQMALFRFLNRASHLILELDCMPDGTQGRRDLELPLRGFIAGAFSHQRSPTLIITATAI